MREDIASLSQKYADDGFAYAKVDPVTIIRDGEKEVDVALMITRGPPVHFNRITIQGNSKTRDKVIRRELDVSEQELVSVGRIKASQSALKRTGYFKNVELTTQKAERPDEMDLMVEVEEGPTGRLNLGGGFSSGEGLIFSAAVAEQNLFGRGQGVSLTADLGSVRQDFVLSFTDSYLFDTNVGFGFDAFNNEVSYTDFDSRRTGFSVRGNYPLRYLDVPFFRRNEAPGGHTREHELSLFRRTRFGTEYGFKRDKVSNIDSNASQEIKSEEGISYTSTVSPSLTFDNRDDFFIPTEGARSSVSLDFAGLGGDNRFLKWDTATAWYYSFLNSPRWGGAYTLGLKGRLGLSTVLDRNNGSDNLPLSDRYFPGGSNSIRGFESRSLGPRDENGEIVGGDKQLVMTAEVVFPVLSQYGLKGVAFFDQGQAFRTSESFDLGEFRRSVGLGARWLSPFGPLQVDFGFALNAKPEDDTSLISFSVGGQSF